jgi:glycosyltransferase involved in cell wall biosynthesis
VSIAEEFSEEAVRVLHYPKRAGKGNALRVGLAQARGRYVAFIDADGDIGPEAIRPFVALMSLYEPDIVLGSKRHPLSEVHYPLLRRVLSWTYHKLARLLFRVKVSDTQTGMKLIRRDVLAAVLPLMLEKRYAFDLELLVVARRFGFKRVFEAPVRIEYQFGSQVNIRAALHIFVDTMAIFYRRYVLNTYRPDGGSFARELTPSPQDALSRHAVAVPGSAHASGGRNGRHRILFINWRDIRNPDAGGAEVFTHEVARRWVEEGHEVSLLTSGFAGGRPRETVDGVRIRRIGRLRNGSFHALAQRELARLRGFDLVVDEINTIPFLTPLWRRRLPPVVALVHQLAGDVWDAEAPAPLAAVGKWLEPRALRLYRDVPVVTISESTKDDLQRLGLPDVSVVPAGRDDPPELNGRPKEPVPTFLFVGRLASNKRPDHAVEAFRHIRESLPDARLWIVGRGPLGKELSKTLPEGAEMLGYLTRDELYRRMARAHCLLVPSVREGWGLVVIEANSVGTPAVGYDVPGVRDSIQHEQTGLLAEAGDPSALARGALVLVRDAARYAVISARALERARLFSWDVTAQALLKVVEEGFRGELHSPSLTTMHAPPRLNEFDT